MKNFYINLFVSLIGFISFGQVTTSISGSALKDGEILVMNRTVSIDGTQTFNKLNNVYLNAGEISFTTRRPNSQGGGELWGKIITSEQGQFGQEQFAGMSVLNGSPISISVPGNYVIKFTYYGGSDSFYEFEKVDVSNSEFYLAPNGVTCMCPNATIGSSAFVKDRIYTKRTRNQITTENAATTCTSGITDMSNLFENDASFYNVTTTTAVYRYSDFNGDISSWDVSSVTNMNSLLNSFILFNQPIGVWDVSNVTSMEAMFYQAKVFNQPIGNWNVGKVTSLSEIFSHTDSFNQPIGDWNVGKVTNMIDMFAYNKVFNQPLGNWDVSSVIYMNSMFIYTTSFNQPIGNWNVSKVTDMGGMFLNANSFNQSIEKWNTSNVTNMGAMFEYAKSFNQPIGNWNTSKVTNISNMFMNASVFNQPIGNWDVSNVVAYFNIGRMFMNAVSFNQDLTKWCVSELTDEPTEFSLNSSISNENKPKWGQECATLSLTSFDNTTALQAFPNPVKNVINVNGFDFNQLTVFDYSGRTIKKETTSNPKIDLSELAKGNYILHLSNGKETQIVKIGKE